MVDTTGALDSKLVEEAAAAINVQVIRDLPKYWNAQATVRYLPDAKSIPVGVWPVFLVAKLSPGEGGVHLDKNNQPYALVIGTPGTADWTIDASHETLEMLVDPAGNRLQTSRAIVISGKTVKDTLGQYEYLVEVCDPCEANQYAYSVNGIAVSDFITPNFYDPVTVVGTRYSFGGNVEQPRQVLPGGYISFVNPASNEMQQILLLGTKPQERNLGPASGASLRAFVDGKTYSEVIKSRKPNRVLSRYCNVHRELIRKAADRRAKTFIIPK